MAWLGLYVLTLNCARNQIDPDLFASHLFDGLSASEATVAANLPEIIVLSLQEVAPLSHAFLGGSWLAPYYEPFRRAVDQAAGDEKYRNVLTRNIGMTAIMVFVRADVADRISWVETAEVGVGVQEAGNKGAVGVRLGYLVDNTGRDTVDLTFVAAHLAPDEFAAEKRNEDWKNICQRLVFTPTGNAEAGSVGHEGRRDRDDEQDEEGVPLLDTPSSHEARSASIYAPNTYLFVAGDLNYRTSDKRPAPGDHLRFPRSTDQVDNSRHWVNLLANDQLTRELKAHRTLHDLTECPIDFPPTYKLQLGGSSPAHQNSGAEWNWSKNRWPSWCDRILYLDAPAGNPGDDEGRVKAHNYDALPLLPSSDHRAVALSISVPLRAVSEPAEILSEPSAACEIDPNWKTRRVTARRKELFVGAATYAIFTREGNALILAACFGIPAVIFALRAFLSG